MKLATIAGVHVDDEFMAFTLSDGRVVAAPTSWSPRLTKATQEQRADYRIDPFGIIVQWPTVDEDIGLWTLLGVPEEEVFEAAGFDVKRASASA